MSISEKLSNEAKIGGLVLLTGLSAFLFAWIIEVKNPFQPVLQFYVTYNFAGGAEKGSPVRLSGIKVGKIESIEFFKPVEPIVAGAYSIAFKKPSDDPNSNPNSNIDKHEKVVVPLKMKISVHPDAAVGVRQDSQFYINLAGIIGERYIEITPGHLNSPQIKAGDVVAGIDPPRIDQLISQSFDLAGKVKEIIDENKGDITRSIEILYKLSNNLNKTFEWVEKSKVFKSNLTELTDNLIAITSDVRKLTSKANSPEGEKTLKLLHELLWRLEPLDSQKIRQFFQKDGVKVQFF